MCSGVRCETRSLFHFSAVLRAREEIPEFCSVIFNLTLLIRDQAMAASKTPIDVFLAIEEMKRISREGGTFSFRFRKWNRATRSGGDVVTVNAAVIRPKASDEKIEYSSYKLFYTDTDTGLARVCWQPLIIEFNGRRTVLN